MEKQERLNKFVIELAAFIESYYSSAIIGVSTEKINDWVIQRINGENDSLIELWTEGAEITISFSESHWHIDDCSEPCNFESIFENTIDDVLDILQGTLITESYWEQGVEKYGRIIRNKEVYEEDEFMKEIKIFENFDEKKIKKWGNKLECKKR